LLTNSFNFYVWAKHSKNQFYQNLKVEKKASLIVKLSLEKNTIYQFSVLQKGIDVEVTLSDKTNPKIVVKDSEYGRTLD
jgi:hypothetical protein